MEGFFTYVGRPAADWLQIWRWPAKANRKPYVVYNVSYLYAAAARRRRRATDSLTTDKTADSLIISFRLFSHSFLPPIAAVQTEALNMQECRRRRHLFTRPGERNFKSFPPAAFRASYRRHMFPRLLTNQPTQPPTQPENESVPTALVGAIQIPIM